MGFLSGLKDKIMGAGKRLSGRTDALEAVTAAAALLAAADGNISDDEVVAALSVVSNNQALSAAFDPRTIETTMDRMLSRAKGGFSGRAGLWKEINDIASDASIKEDVYLIALDVAHADGDVGTAEKAVLDKLAKTLGLDPAKYA